MLNYCSGGFSWRGDGKWGCDESACLNIYEEIEHKITNMHLWHFRQFSVTGLRKKKRTDTKLIICKSTSQHQSTFILPWIGKIVTKMKKKQNGTEMVHNFFWDHDWNATTLVSFREQRGDFTIIQGRITFQPFYL